jgi:hypothetical protein
VGSVASQQPEVQVDAVVESPVAAASAVRAVSPRHLRQASSVLSEAVASLQTRCLQPALQRAVPSSTSSAVLQPVWAPLVLRQSSAASIAASFATRARRVPADEAPAAEASLLLDY